MFPHRSTNRARRCLTSLMSRQKNLSWWQSAVSFFLLLFVDHSPLTTTTTTTHNNLHPTPSSIMPLEEFLVPLQTPCVYYCEDLLQDDAPAFYDALWKGIPWQTTPKINRWVHLQLADGLDYKYRDAPATAVQHGWHPVVDQIRHRVQDWYQQQTGQSIDFNVCLLNFYQDGNQRIGWHADREEIGRTTPIASVSLGATRQFLLRSKTDGVRDRASLALAQGSVVFMENICQHQYLHAVPRESAITDGRINLTFRCSHGTTEGEQAHERRDNFVQQLVEGVAPQKVGWAAVGDNDDESQQSHVFGNGVRTEPPSSGEPPAYIAKTNLGAECYCAAELQETFPDCTIVARHPVDGYVAVYGHASVDKLVALRTPHHVMEYHVHFALDALVDHQCPELSKVDGETLYQYVKKELVEQRVSIPSLETAASFRVTCDRIGGPHAFKSPEVERYVESVDDCWRGGTHLVSRTHRFLWQRDWRRHHGVLLRLQAQDGGPRHSRPRRRDRVQRRHWITAECGGHDQEPTFPAVPEFGVHQGTNQRTNERLHCHSSNDDTMLTCCRPTLRMP